MRLISHDCMEARKSIQILDEGVVYANPEPLLRSRQAFHPSLANLGNGEILCGFEMGEAVESQDYRAHRCRSRDNGKTWVFEGALFENVPGVTSATRISRTRAGLVGFGARYYRLNPGQGLLNRENLGMTRMELVLTRSADNGKSWGAPSVLVPPLVGPAFEMCHAVVELPGGRWLAPTATWRGWNGDLPNGNKAIVLISDDQGRSWPEYGISFASNNSSDIFWEQSVHLWRDALLSVCWHFDSASQRHLPNKFAVSRDGGKTFSNPAEIGIHGQTCKALVLNDDYILLAYRRVDKPGLWLSLFTFNGKAWNLLSEKPLWGHHRADSGMTGKENNADALSGLCFGFPQMTRLDDKTILLVFWRLEKWSSDIRYFRIVID